MPAEPSEPSGAAGPSTAEALALLRRADLDIAGRLVAASNTTLYCRLVDLDGGGETAPEGGSDGVPTVAPSGQETPADGGEGDLDPLDGPGCVYKPVAGERPLWDFPDGTLAAREVAAFELSERTGWGLVPPTILRDGPLGLGMCQLWVEEDHAQQLVDILPRGRVPRGWLHVVDAHGGAGEEVMLVHADDVELRRTAVFDVVINNADRKGGHLLATADGLRVVDHGVSYHVEPKLRTVLWGWAGSPLRDEEVEVLTRLRADLDDELGAVLSELLTREEVRQTARRVDRLLRTLVLPAPVHGWRGLPWPPF